MAAIGSILAVVDFSRSIDHTLRRAALLAAEHDAQLRLIHVVSPAGCRPLCKWLDRPVDIRLKLAQAKATLDRCVAQLAGHHRLDVRAEIRVGDAQDEILHAAQRADLVVVGARGANPLRELLLGAAAERLVRTVRRPVLIVKRPPLRPYRRALVPLDFAACSVAALQLASIVAPRAGIHAFHAVEPGWEMKLRAADVAADVVADHAAAARQEACRQLHALAAEAALPRAIVRFAVRHGDAASLILAEESRIDADLVIIGKDGHSAMAAFLLGGVVQRVLRGTRSDTLVVPRATPAGRNGRRDRAEASPWAPAHRRADPLNAVRDAVEEAARR
jgi:nucleotide-binding universal stress UspA family protein